MDVASLWKEKSTAVPPEASLEELMAKDHPRNSIFRERPAVGTVECEGHLCAVPYHNYDSKVLVLWGSADAGWVSKHLEGPWRPLLGKDGRAIVSLWIVQYVNTCLNPYNEAIIVFSTVHESKPDPPRVSDPLQCLQLFDDKLASPYVYKLWLDEKLPVTYGRDSLGCDKYLDAEMKISYDKSNTAVEFAFHHVANERNSPPVGALLSGNVQLSRMPHVALQPMHLLSLVRAYGLFRSLGMVRGARNSWHVVNPPGVMNVVDSEKVNPVWDFMYETMPKFTYATEGDLKYGGELSAMDFKAKVYMHDAHLRAVILPPWTYTRVSKS